MAVIAKRIKDAREAAKMSQAELSREIGVSAVAVWQFENEENKSPSLTTLKKISEVLKVSINYLMGIDDVAIKEDEILFRNLKRLNPASKKMIQDMANFLAAKQKFKSK